MTPNTALGPQPRLQMQGTAVAIEGRGVLLRGPSGAGKSSLALRLIEDGAILIADDLCELRRSCGWLTIDLPAAVDPAFLGAIERRGQGIVKVAYAGAAPLALIVDLAPMKAPPDTIQLLGVAIPRAVLDPFQADSVATLRKMALASDRLGPLQLKA
jgi:HPr kinase/phosphorylase